jgi:hypothetical protein
VAGKVEPIGDGITDGNETLKVAGRFEAFHDPLPSSGRLMRILRSLVQSLVGSMLYAGHEFVLGGIIGTLHFCTQGGADVLVLEDYGLKEGMSPTWSYWKRKHPRKR